MQRTLPLAFLGLLVACGGSAEGWSVEDYCPQSSRVQCARLEHCGLLDAGETLEGCVATQSAKCTADFAPVVEAIHAGRLDYDGAKAKACYDLYSAVPGCFRITERFTLYAEMDADPDCHFITGTLANGDACFGPGSGYDECAEGYCPGACPATCVPYPKPGEACDPYGGGPPCDPDTAFCNGDGVCETRHRAGEACDRLVHRQCAPGLVCLVGYVGDGVCGEFAPDGAPCGTDYDCMSWLCLDGACTSTPGAGERCSLEGSTCPDGLVCRHGGDSHQDPLVCGAPSQVGEPCILNIDCRDGLDCVMDANGNGACGTLPGAGAPCAYGQCKYPALCDDGTDTCVRLAQLGEACSWWPEEVDCEYPLVCSSQDVCIEPQPLGAWCGGDLECASGFCVDGTCAPAECPEP